MDYLIELIKEWGYVIVFLGACVEGESIILTASFLAYYGYLSIVKVMMVAFTATLFADQALFWVGKVYGDRIFMKYPQLKERLKKAFVLLHKYDQWFILTFRFIYGIRTLSPIVIGAANIDTVRYTILNFIAAVIWTVISCGVGYFGAKSIKKIITNFETYGLVFLGGIVAAIIGYVIYNKLNKKD